MEVGRRRNEINKTAEGGGRLATGRRRLAEEGRRPAEGARMSAEGEFSRGNQEIGILEI